MTALPLSLTDIRVHTFTHELHMHDSDPLPRLPTTGTGAGAHCVLYAALESLGDDIPKLLVCGNETLRQQIEARLSPSVVAMGLPPPLSDDDGAGGRRRKDELERVLLLVSFIAHAYVW